MAHVEVYNYKTHIFDIEMDERLNVSEVGKVFNEKLLPVMFRNGFTKSDVEKWIQKRLLPSKERIGIARVREMFPSSDIARPHTMFSLTDQYWFRWNENEEWEKRNFFTNDYFTDYGRMYFDPSTVKDKNLKEESPDMTTNGALPKRWVRDSEFGVSYMIKMGNRDAHQEAISEVLSSMTLDRLKIIDHVPYTLAVDGLGFCSKCPNFIHENEEFVPASQVFNLAKRDPNKEDVKTHLVAMIKKYIPELKGVENYLDRMATADYCICNNDRHLGNFGFIRDTTTGEITRFAPLFDSGSAFFGNANASGRESVLFTDEQVKEAVDRVFKKLPNTVLKRLKEDELIELVDTYPLLTAAEKEKIKKKITAVYGELRTLILARSQNKIAGMEMEF